MRYDRKIKMLSIIALVLAIAGMSLGFAAFSSTLTISSSATVTPNSDDFKVVNSGSSTDINEKNLSYTSAGLKSEAIATIDGKKISISDVVFSEPGSGVKFGFYSHNIGKYNAYLKKVEYKNVEGYNTQIVCTPVDTDTTAELVAEACKGISYSLTIVDANNIENNFLYYYGKYEISNAEPLLPSQVLSSYVEISYSESAARADGPFIVQFGDIEIDISSAE